MRLGMNYITEHFPEHIDEDMRAIADTGCSEVLVSFLEPSVTGGIDGGFRRAAEIGHRHGLKVYASIWGIANTFGGGKVSKFMLEDPVMWRVRADGTRFAKACLNHPALLDHFENLSRKCHERGYEGIFLDGAGRMREEGGEREKCFCEHCRAQFRARYGGDLVAARNSPEFEAFAADTLVEFVSGFCARIKGIDRHLKTIACFWPRERQTNWERISALDALDIFGGYPYWFLPYVDYSSVEAAVDDAQAVQRLASRNGKESWIWLGAYLVPAGREEELVYQGGQALAAAGCDALYTWTYRGGLGTYEESEDPGATWAQVQRLYGVLAGR